MGLGPVDIREIGESGARRPDDRKIDEALRLAALLSEGSALWALDERAQISPAKNSRAI